MKLKTFWIFLLLTAVKTNGQTLMPFTISSSGGYFSNASGSISTTVAEMTMVETYSNTNNHITQGFQQTTPGLITSVSPVGLPGLFLNLFPNPAFQKLYLSIKTNYAIKATGTLYDATGRKLMQINFSQTTGLHVYEYSTEAFNSGFCLFELLIQKVSGNTSGKFISKLFISH